MNIELRPYQQECVDTINNLENGSHLVSVATGLGKTVIFSQLKRHYQKFCVKAKPNRQKDGFEGQA